MPNEKVFAREFGIRARRWIAPELFVEGYEIGHDPVSPGVYQYPIVVTLRAAARSAQELLSMFKAFLERTGGLAGRVVYTSYGNPYTLSIGEFAPVEKVGDSVRVRSTGRGVRRYDIPGQGEETRDPVWLGVRWAAHTGLSGDGILRRSPSNVLRIGGIYYVWYRREPSRRPVRPVESRRDTPARPGPGRAAAPALGQGPTALSDPSGSSRIWMASSPDGRRWTEQGPVVRVSRGAWHSRRRGAPCVIQDEGRLVMFFSHAGDMEDRTRAITRCVGDSPSGPFRVIDSGPVLTPSGVEGSFDGAGVDHPCVVKRNGVCRLYFAGRSPHLPALESRLGVAMGARPGGPFKRRRSPCMTAQTACLWLSGDHLVLIGDSDRPSLQQSADGIHFKRLGAPDGWPQDAGVSLPDGEALPWGLASAPADTGLARFDLVRSR